MPRQDERIWRRVVVGALALAVGAAAAVVVGSVVDTAESRFAGSTDNRGSLFEAGEVRLTLGRTGPGQPDARSELSLSAQNLLPGQTVERCVAVSYNGDFDDVDLRLYGRNDGGDGLEDYLDATIEVGSGDDPACSDFELASSDPVRWDGQLSELDAVAGRYDDGIRIVGNESDVTVRFTMTLTNDNRAQGLNAAFWIVFEVRP